ncbi:MAG: nucleotidyltransferase domain-containing protein [Deltaproteobacteria bacterium]|nr:nucleotidyltransferase domain-containing protein [Deltaproteobacteria bacterium]
MAAEHVVGSVRRYLDVLRDNGIDAAFAVLFGSQVKGDADEWSDIDLVVVAPYFDGHRNHDDVTPLWLLAMQVDPSIEPIACGLKEWNEDDSRPILEVARREGRLIGLSDSGS